MLFIGRELFAASVAALAADPAVVDAAVSAPILGAAVIGMPIAVP